MIADDAAPDQARYCAFDHKEFWRDGIYVRARGHIPVHRADGSTVYVCGRCYYDHLDKCGLSVQAQLLRDPESIPAQWAERIKRESEEW